MLTSPESCDLTELYGGASRKGVVLASRSVRKRAQALPFDQVENTCEIHANTETLIVVGGGSLIDQAKYWRWQNRPDVTLIAIPSIWGSGAEISPVAVLDQNGEKTIHVDQALVPDSACFWPELAETIPDGLAVNACGDAWSHAIEGFLSPLADDELRRDLGAVINRMLKLPLANDSRWFELSALACAGQALSSVGLVHGIAHTLEAPLRKEFPGSGWSHAKLCSVFLLPVMAFNRRNSDKWATLCETHEIDPDAVFSMLQQLHDRKAYNQALPLLEQGWMKILRDPCSRTNSCLVRPAGRSYFLEQFGS